jgi:hypothetical protein
MRDGVVSVAEAGAGPSVSLLRLLKREFGFYCIELCVEQPKMAYVIGGGFWGKDKLASMERYDVSSGQWSSVAAMGTARGFFGACVVAGEVYAIGGQANDDAWLSSVEKYTPLSDNWSARAPLPAGRSHHAAIAMGSAMYVLGGKSVDRAATTSVLKLDTVQDQGTYAVVAPMPEAKYAFAACAIGTDIYVFGGFGGGRPHFM